MQSTIAFLYDRNTLEKRFERFVFDVEVKVAQKNLGGQVYRLGDFRDFRETLNEAARTEIKTFVVVGAEKTFLDAIMFCPNHEIAFGFVPVFQSPLATCLGIPIGPSAVDVLSARCLERFDLGFVNDVPFFNEVTWPQVQTTFISPDGYRLKPKDTWAMSVRNVGQVRAKGADLADPTDGKLELVVQTGQTSRSSWLPWKQTEVEQMKVLFDRATVEAEQEIEAFVDGQTLKASSFQFRIQPQLLRVIVSRERFRSTG